MQVIVQLGNMIVRIQTKQIVLYCNFKEYNHIKVALYCYFGHFYNHIKTTYDKIILSI